MPNDFSAVSNRRVNFRRSRAFFFCLFLKKVAGGISSTSVGTAANSAGFSSPFDSLFVTMTGGVGGFGETAVVVVVAPDDTLLEFALASLTNYLWGGECKNIKCARLT